MPAPGYGLRIIDARRRKGLTQVGLCKQIGAGLISVSRWENEQNEPQAFSWHRLASALDSNVEWLRDGVGPRVLDLSTVTSEALIAELFRRGYRQR